MPFSSHKKISENEKMTDVFKVSRINDRNVSAKKISAQICFEAGLGESVELEVAASSAIAILACIDLLCSNNIYCY